MPPSPRPLSVRFISRKWPPAVGGMERYCEKLAERFEAMCDLDLLVLPGKPDGSVPSAPALLKFGATGFASLLFAKKAPDVAHVTDVASWPLAWAAKLRSRATLIVISAHGTDVSYFLREGWRARLYQWYLRLASRLVGSAVMIANSDATARVLSDIGFSNIRTIPLASDLAPASDGSFDAGHVLFAGRLVERKGLSWFVGNVLPRLPDTIRLYVAGPKWDEREAAFLDHPQVTYLGTLNSDALAKEYREALCVVMPNVELATQEFEGFGLIAVEAAASGAVVLGANTGGIKQAILNEETGFLLPSGDADAWAEKISQIADWSDAQRSEFLAKARDCVATHYSWDRVARETFQAFGLARNGDTERPQYPAD